ncbi:hypothetical protein [Bacillus sp. RO1]|uniref:hypothetical protein n=1 Tax=Bacillus sp. RO1 TaxID=2722703 RepID=UPI0014567122|nr:hypothetical protein [Bacillus sp. RO1]NLP50294.1 hypothetical protein [Bacillus sp. RO1]
MINKLPNAFSIPENIRTDFSKNKSMLVKRKIFSPFGQIKRYKGSSPILMVIPSTDINLLALGITLQEISLCHLMIVKRFTPKVETRIERYIAQYNIRGLIGIEEHENNGYEYMYNDHFHPLINYITEKYIGTTVPNAITMEEDYCLKENKPSVKFFIHNKDAASFLPVLLSILKVLPTQIEHNQKPWTTASVSDAFKVSMITPFNRLELTIETQKKWGLREHDYVFVLNPITGSFRKCIVYETKKNLNSNEVTLSAGVKKSLFGSSPPGPILIQKAARYPVHQIQTQNAADVQLNRIIVSENMLNKLKATESPYVELMNPHTGASFDFHLSQLAQQPGLNDDKTIKLNYIQRQFLDYEQPPDYIPPTVLTNLCLRTDDSNKELCLTDAEQTILKETYGHGKVLERISYQESLQLKKVLKKAGYYHTFMYPVNHYYKESRKTPILKRLGNKLLTAFIGNKQLSLKVIRPYTSDETSNIIRLTKSTMTLLGIEEADTVILSYRNKTAKAQVLEMNDLDLIKETNIMSSSSLMNISVAVPSTIRTHLGLNNIGKVIVVERDMAFLLKKNFNIQFVPIIAVMFTVLSVSILTTWTRILLLLLFVPLSMYVTLSRVRYSISNKKQSY